MSKRDWRTGKTDAEWFRRRRQEDRVWWWVTRALEVALAVVVAWCVFGGKGI